MFIDRVKNGVECIEQIEKQPTDYYSLILMNIQMPILDGYYTTQKIRRMNDPIRSHIPIISMTANADRKSTRLNSSHRSQSRMPSSA